MKGKVISVFCLTLEFPEAHVVLKTILIGSESRDNCLGKNKTNWVRKTKLAPSTSVSIDMRETDNLIEKVAKVKGCGYCLVLTLVRFAARV